MKTQLENNVSFVWLNFGTTSNLGQVSTDLVCWCNTVTIMLVVLIYYKRYGNYEIANSLLMEVGVMK